MPPLQRRRSMGDRSRQTAGGVGRGGRLHSPAAGIVGPAPLAADVPGVGCTPSDPPPLNGGEFLLQLLHRPPQSSPAAPSPAPSASPLPIDGQRGRQHPHHGQYEDPAVAAVGPSHPFSPPNFSNFGSPQQHYPWLFPSVHSRPSPPLGFSPPGGFSVSPPAGFSVSPPVGYSASPPGINYHEPRSLSGGNRPSFFHGEAGQPPVFAPRNLDTGDHRGNLRDTFSQQQQRQQPTSNYKQNHHRDGFSAGGTAPGNMMFGSPPSNLQGNSGRGLITGNPSTFAGRSQLGVEQRNSKASPATGHDRRLGNGGGLENQPLPNFRRAPQPEGWSDQPGNQQHVRETRARAPMTGQPPPGFHDPSAQRHSRMKSRREASSSQQKPNGSGHRISMDGGPDRDFGLKRHEYPQGTENHQSSTQRMGTQALERHVHPDAYQVSSVPVAELDVKELVDDILSEDDEEDAFFEEQDNGIDHNSEPKPISDSSILFEEKSLVVQLEDSLVLKEEVVECEGKKSRKKDFRTDFSRGQKVSVQRYRIRRGSIQCRHDIRKLSPQFFSVYELLVPTAEQKAKQKQLLLSLQKIVSKEWPNAQLHLYGSCANSFGVLKSDIDVCLEIDDSETNKADLLLNLADLLQSDNLQNVQALTRARVPIVKLMDPVTGLSCDICINNLLAVVNTKLLRDYGKIDERLRQLAFIVKHWAKSRGVNETYQGTLSSYAYVIMCIHFLQMRRPPILPCLQTLEPTYVTTVDGVECSFFDQVEKLQNFGSANKETVAELLWAFFNYWAYRHDYANDVISVRTGSILSKREKDWTRRIGNDRHLICIEDPFEVSHDLGRVVDKHTIKILREEFERAADILQFDPNPCAVLFEPYVREPPPASPPAAENQAELSVV